MSLDEVGIKNDIHIYPEVNHIFANPSRTDMHQMSQKMLSFFENSMS